MPPKTRSIPDDVRARLEMSIPWRKNLRTALRVRDISLADASIRCGFNHEYMSKVLGGLNPTIDRLLYICDRCDIPADEVFSRTNSAREADKIVEALSTMNADELALAQRILASIK